MNRQERKRERENKIEQTGEWEKKNYRKKNKDNVDKHARSQSP